MVQTVNGKIEKARIALIIPGGLGTGRRNMGIPVLQQIVDLLSVEFDITVFSLFKVNDGYEPEGFEIINILPTNPVARGLALFRAFRNQHRKRQFSVVHGFWVLPSGTYAVLLAKIFGIKAVVSVLGGDAISLPQIKYGQLNSVFSRAVVRWTLKRAGVVIVLTKYLAANLKRYNAEPSNMRVVPWGIDARLFPYVEKPFSSPIRFLHIANLTPVKDQMTLLRTFQLIRRSISGHLTIVGEGPEEKMLRAESERLGIADAVTFTAPVPYDELSVFYHQADILLHTSLSEGQSEVITEAMNAGVVVCGTAVGLLYDLPEACFSVPVGDYKQLAAGVLTLQKDANRMDVIRQTARNWAKEHSLTWTVNEIAGTYK